METLTLEEYLAKLKAQKVPRQHVASKCPMCGTVQSMQSLINAGTGKTQDDVEKFFGFSCVGRWTNAGPHHKGTPPGRGCDWTLGGLLGLHKLEVVTEDGERHMRFEVATPEEAVALMNSHPAPTPAGVPATA